MANYNVQYRMQFADSFLSDWTVDLCLKDGHITAEPIIIEADATPLIFDKSNSNENKFTPIIETKCTIQYVCRPNSTDPEPETFILIQADDWLVNVYKDGSIWWKGFIKIDRKSYPWVPKPFSFSMVASDFSFSKGVPMSQNDPDNGLFDYNYITVGDFIKRTLFESVGYEDCILNILYAKKPTIIGSDTITEAIFIHMDAFYDFEKGPDYCFDALQKFARSIGARLFHDQGAYWLQFIEDIGLPGQTILQLTPDNLTGTLIPFNDYSIVMGNAPGDGLVYLNRSAEILTNDALKQQEFIYDLKAINQVPNFDWRTNVAAPYDNWQSSPVDNGKWIRSGTGSVEDPYRIQVLRTGLLDGNLQTQDGLYIPVRSGQLIELHIKNKGFLTLGSPSEEDYEIQTNIVIVLANIDDPEDLYNMDGSGDWSKTPLDPIILFGSKPGNDPSVTEILSKPIPSVPGVNLGIVIAIIGTTISKEPPPGSSYYSELYPVFIGRFITRYVQYVEKIVNNAKFSYIAESQDMFFLDSQDAGYSNTLFYHNGTDFLPLPAKNWTNNKNIDEIAVKQYGDEQAVTTNAIMGTFRSNNLNLAQGILLRDKSFIRTIQIRDKYNVRKAEHDLMCMQLLEEGAATLNYTVTPVTSNNKK